MQPTNSCASGKSDQRPTLGVVVPTLDEGELIGALVQRLARGADADDRADRVIVADGGSGDETRAIAAENGAEVVCAPRGRGSQLAAGAALLDSDLLLFLHADCMPLDGTLARVRAAFRDPELICAAMHQRIEARGAFYRCVERAADKRVAWFGIVYGDSGLALRRAAYASVGGFRALPLFEDIDLARRLRVLARPRLIDGAVLGVSPRRWRREGALRATLRNWMLLLAYSAGARPEALARFYPSHARATRSS
jgi:rSAM/selenodomain-associated transferase 2